MADQSSGRLVSFLVEGDEVVSCEVCMEPFHATSRPPKLLPCGHNFCGQCLFSLCCHQQYYLLDVINCPTCRAPFSTSTARAAPTNYDLCKILENLHKGMELNNVTVIQVPDVSLAEKRIGTQIRVLADKSRDAKHHRCFDCKRKLSAKSLVKTARLCEMCNNTGALKFFCLECCVNNHNGHQLLSIPQMEANQLKTLSELREIRKKLLDVSEAFDRRVKEIGSKASSQAPVLHGQKQTMLVEMLAELDEAIRRVEVPKLIAPNNLNAIRNHQIHNLAKLTKMNSLLEKTVHSSQPVVENRLKKSSSFIRQSRLSLRGDDSLTREALSTLLSILPDDDNFRKLQAVFNSISPKDTIEQRKQLFLDCAQIITNILYGEIACDDIPIVADALLNSYYQLNILSRKRNDNGATSRKNIWKSTQFAYSQLMRIAAKSFPACHPERVDCLDDLAYLCHLYSDVCDQATVALLMIEAARARAAESHLSPEDQRRTEERLKMVDDHLVELRRLQRLQDLRSKTKIKSNGRVKSFWKSIFSRNRSQAVR